MEHVYAEIADSVYYEGTNIRLPTKITSKSCPLLNTQYPPLRAHGSAQWYASLSSVRGVSRTPEVHGPALYQQDSEDGVEILELPSSPKYCRHSIAATAIRQLSTVSQDPLPTEAEEYLGTASVVQEDGSGREDQPTANRKSWRMSWPTYSHLLTQAYPASIEPLQRIKSQDL